MILNVNSYKAIKLSILYWMICVSMLFSSNLSILSSCPILKSRFSYYFLSILLISALSILIYSILFLILVILSLIILIWSDFLKCINYKIDLFKEICLKKKIICLFVGVYCNVILVTHCE